MKPTRLRLDRLESRLAPAVATWDGGGADNHWTTAANWVGDVAPHSGDDLVFPSGAPQHASVNDFPAGTAFHSIAISEVDFTQRYVLSGNAIALAAGLSVDVGVGVSPSDTTVIGLPLTLTADQTFSDVRAGYNLTGSVDLNGHALTVSGVFHFETFSGPITGTGSLSFLGGRAVLSGASTFAGPTTVSQSATLDVTGTLPGPVTVLTSDYLFGTLSGSGTVGDVTVTSGELIPGDPFTFPRSPSVLKTGNLSAAAAKRTSFDIVAPGAATGVAVTGTVQLGGRLSLGALADVTIRPGDRFTLISNDGADAIVGTFANAPEGTVLDPLLNGRVVCRITYHGGDGNDLVATAEAGPAYAVGAGPGGLPVVNVYGTDGQLVRSFLAYASGFRGGVRVATADVTGDGILDVITAAGPGGGPHVKVFDGTNFAVVREFMAYDPAFTGGVFVAASQINGGSQADIITGAGAGGGPHVKVFDGKTGATLSSFFAYDAAFRGGVSVAGTDVANSAGSVITGPGPGGGPDVRVFNGETGALTLEFLAYDPSFRGGVNVASRGPVYSFIPPPPPTGDLPPPTTITVGAIVTAPASNGGPDVRLFDANGQQIGEFLAYDAAFTGGVTVAVATNDGSGFFTVVTGAGPGGGPHVKVWRAANNVSTLQQSFFALDPAFRGGVFVG